MPFDSLTAPIPGADRRVIGGVQIEVVRAGASRVKRMIYPTGFRWSSHMQPITGTELCSHAHVGFLARGSIHVRFADGCVKAFTAPQVIAIEPGHDGWVDGDEPAVVVEFDFERDTTDKLGLGEHRH